MGLPVKISDPVLDEIHRIRRSMAFSLRSGSWKKWYQKLQASNRQFLKEKGYRFVKTPEGHLKIVRKT